MTSLNLAYAYQLSSPPAPNPAPRAAKNEAKRVSAALRYKKKTKNAKTRAMGLEPTTFGVHVRTENQRATIAPSPHFIGI